MRDPADLIKTRFLILSDTHSATPSDNVDNKNVAFRAPLPKADVLLHCGDLTMIGLLHEYEKTLDMLESIDADLKLVIAGNHDITLDEKYYARKGAYMHRHRGFDPDMSRKARDMWMGERAQKAGVTYLEEGTHTFTLANGASLRVYASPYQPYFCDFAFPYARNQDRYNPKHQCTPGAESIAENPVPGYPGVDVMMTHGPPMGILDSLRTGEHVGCEHLLRAARRCKPQLHCFGHIHEGSGAKIVDWQEGDGIDANFEGQVRKTVDFTFDAETVANDRAVKLDIGKDGDASITPGSSTLMVNASIMTVGNRPWNTPWLINLDLERAKMDE